MSRPGHQPTDQRRREDEEIPLALKAGHTAFVAVLVPAYARHYGPGNFLWFSDVALIASVPALWLRSPLLASMQAVGVLVPESVWIADLAAGTIAGKYPVGLASYMSDRRIPRFIRALSLFHLWLAPVLVLVISRAGYDRRALGYQAVATWANLIASWRLTKPADNVNWVYSRPWRIRSKAGRAGFVLLLMAAMPLAFHLPAHLLLRRLYPAPRRRSEQRGTDAQRHYEHDHEQHQEDGGNHLRDGERRAGYRGEAEQRGD